MILKIQLQEEAIEIDFNRNLRIPSCVSLLCEMEIYFAEVIKLPQFTRRSNKVFSIKGNSSQSFVRFITLGPMKIKQFEAPLLFTNARIRTISPRDPVVTPKRLNTGQS